MRDNNKVCLLSGGEEALFENVQHNIYTHPPLGHQ